MPLEVLQRIGSFAAPSLANKDVNSIISAHLNRSKDESVEASSSASAALGDQIEAKSSIGHELVAR